MPCHKEASTRPGQPFCVLGIVNPLPEIRVWPINQVTLKAASFKCSLEQKGTLWQVQTMMHIVLLLQSDDLADLMVSVVTNVSL